MSMSLVFWGETIVYPHSRCPLSVVCTYLFSVKDYLSPLPTPHGVKPPCLIDFELLERLPPDELVILTKP